VKTYRVLTGGNLPQVFIAGAAGRTEWWKCNGPQARKPPQPAQSGTRWWSRRAERARKPTRKVAKSMAVSSPLPIGFSTTSRCPGGNSSPSHDDSQRLFEYQLRHDSDQLYTDGPCSDHHFLDSKRPLRIHNAHYLRGRFQLLPLHQRLSVIRAFRGKLVPQCLPGGTHRHGDPVISWLQQLPSRNQLRSSHSQ
jgi:hypothetical protein